MNVNNLHQITRPNLCSIAEVVISVLKDYNISKRLGYFVLDNAGTNDTCVEEILRQLRPDLTTKECRL